MKKVCLLVMSLVLVLALAATAMADTITFRMADNQADGTPNVEATRSSSSICRLQEQEILRPITSLWMRSMTRLSMSEEAGHEALTFRLRTPMISSS